MDNGTKDKPEELTPEQEYRAKMTPSQQHRGELMGLEQKQAAMRRRNQSARLIVNSLAEIVNDPNASIDERIRAGETALSYETRRLVITRKKKKESLAEWPGAPKGDAPHIGEIRNLPSGARYRFVGWELIREENENNESN